MTTAQSIFVVHGVVILAYGFMLGIALAAYRMKAPRAPQHLVTTHLSAVIQGAVHLGLAFAIGFADLGTGWAVAAAWLLVAGSSFEIVGGTINWLSGTRDQFVEKSLGFRFNLLGGPSAIIGIVSGGEKDADVMCQSSVFFRFDGCTLGGSPGIFG